MKKVSVTLRFLLVYVFVMFLTIPISTVGAKLVQLSGVVCADGQPIAGVFVSDGQKIVKTNSQGIYKMQSMKRNGFVFVITPTNYEVPCQDALQPAFWQPLNVKDENEVHNFTLKKVNQTHASIVMMTDIHFTNSNKKHDLKHFEALAFPFIKQTAAECKSRGPVYAMQLGDFTHDVYWYQFNFNEEKGREYLIKKRFPVPMYSIPGNHDNDGAVVGKNVDFRAEKVYRETFGPTYYSTNIGDVHWVMLDDIIYKNTVIPGKKPKGVDIKGERDYDVAFTPAELSWIKQDLALVDPSTQVCICTHAPLIIDAQKVRIVIKGQMDSLETYLSKFKDVKIFSGHLHRCAYFTSNKYPRFEQYVLPALSGNMWETSDNYQTIGLDGALGGFFVQKIDNGTLTTEYKSIEHPNKIMRAYDMNTVGEYYRTNNDVIHQYASANQRNNYANYSFKNDILVNYWFYLPGDKVEIFEGRNPLKVERKNYEDPLFNISYNAPRHRKDDKGRQNNHLWIAKAKTAINPIEIRILNKEGKLIYSENMQRPKKFDKNIQ